MKMVEYDSGLNTMFNTQIFKVSSSSWAGLVCLSGDICETLQVQVPGTMYLRILDSLSNLAIIFCLGSSTLDPELGSLQALQR